MASSPWSTALLSLPAVLPTITTSVDALRVNGRNLDHESPIEELFEDQLTAADLIILNKTDLLDSTGLAFVRNEVASRTSRKPSMIEAKNGEVSAASCSASASAPKATSPTASPITRWSMRPVSHSHDEFDSFVVELGPIADPAGFHRKAEADHRRARRAAP
jgi:cobalamin biosynthesis protein CobW